MEYEFNISNQIKYVSFSLVILFLVFVSNYFHSNTKVVFCDVGQGDAIYMRINNKYDVLIDAGSSKKVLDCLGKNMPFYDRTIEAAFLTHEEKDHYGGFLYLKDKYKIKNLYISTRLEKEDLRKIFKNYKLVSKGFVLKVFSSEFRVLSPELSLGLNRDKNENSMVISFLDRKKMFLLTGDANLINNIVLLEQSKRHIDVLKLPHHGSVNNINLEFVKLADPYYIVISVGKNNQYHHPSKILLDKLTALNKKIFRTDQDGDVIFLINRKGELEI